MSISPTTYTTPSGAVYSYAGHDANCTVSACPIELSIYGYRPSLPLSSLLIALYALAALIQLGFGFRYRSWGFVVAMVLGCIDEILGYAGRIMLYQNPWDHSGFIMQIVLITIGPVFFSAAVYVLLSRIIENIAPKMSRFAPRAIYCTFIPLDTTSLVLQAVGGAMSSASEDGSSTGVNIALAGLALQVATLVLFIGLSIDYLVRSRTTWKGMALTTRFRTFVVALSAAIVLILIRCSYRVYELNSGYQRTSAALRELGLFIGLESVMIILVAYIMIFAHPGYAFHNGVFRDAKMDDSDGSAGEK